MTQVEYMLGKRLNFVIPVEIEQALDNYCEQTGRTTSDVIRQLLCEYVDGDRELKRAPKEETQGTRSNLILASNLLDSLDLKITKENYGGSRGAVIGCLLKDFLENRVGPIKECITVLLEKTLYNKLYGFAEREGLSVSDKISKICEDFTQKNKDMKHVSR